MRQRARDKLAVTTTSMELAVIDNHTNQVVGSVPAPDADNPHSLPHAGTVLWHSLRFEYFEAMLSSSALYFSRVDKQSDKQDGMYSEANARKFTPAVDALMRKLNIESDPQPQNWEMS